MLAISSILPQAGFVNGYPLELSDAEREKIEAAFANLNFSLRAFKRNPLFTAQQPHIFRTITETFANCLEPGNRLLIESFFRMEDEILYLSGFPAANIPPTPATITERTVPHISEFISIGLLGMAKRELGNLKFGNVVLNKEDNLHPTNNKDEVFEPWHTHDNMADYGILYCLRGSPNVHSLIISPERLFAALPTETRQLLFKDLHYFGTDKAPVALMTQRNNHFIFSREFTQTEDFFRNLTAIVIDMTYSRNPDMPQILKLALAMQANLDKAVTWVNYKLGEVAIINQSTLRGVLVEGVDKPDVTQRYLLSTTAQLGQHLEYGAGLGFEHLRNVLHCSNRLGR